MRAWIARDHGRQLISYSEPKWATITMGKGGCHSHSSWHSPTGWAPLPDEIVNQIQIPENTKQQIELAARPIGEAEGGGT